MITNLHTFSRDGLGKIHYLFEFEGMSATTDWLALVLIERMRHKLPTKPLFIGISMRYISGEEL
jgi:hypothetical protein